MIVKTHKGEHIFVSAGGENITGIVDWSDAALCDPIEDLQSLPIWLGAGFLRLVLEHYRGPVDGHIGECATIRARYGCLRAVGERLAGRSNAPLNLLLTQLHFNLLLTQLHWAFTDE